MIKMDLLFKVLKLSKQHSQIY